MTLARKLTSIVELAFRQFRPRRAASLVAARVSARVWDPSAQPSYGQHGEDRVIAYYFEGRSRGFYVDVGCNRPEEGSNTYALYRAGWRGICVDANEALIQQFRRARPKDTVIHAVVSSATEELEFTTFDDDLVSTVSSSHRAEWSGRRRVMATTRVRPARLDDLLRANGAPPAFDLLSVDAEGHDLEVLCSMDFAEFRPRLVVVEMLDFDLECPRRDPVYEHLSARGYRLVGFTMGNGYFEDARPRREDMQ